MIRLFALVLCLVCVPASAQEIPGVIAPGAGFQMQCGPNGCYAVPVSHQGGGGFIAGQPVRNVVRGIRGRQPVRRALRGLFGGCLFCR